MRGLALILFWAALIATPARADDLLDDLRHDDDAIAANVAQLLSSAMQGDYYGVQRQLTALDTTDAERKTERLGRTGLLDDARYLAAALEPSRDGRRQALEALLKQDPDDLVEREVETRLETDDGLAADQLLSDDRHNRRATLVNDAIRPLGIFSGAVFIAAVNPFLLAGSAIDSVATTAINLWNYNHLSPPEREALVRYRTLLKRDPGTIDAAAALQAIRTLGEKRAKALCEQTVDEGLDALDKDDLDHARYYLAFANHTEGCQPKTEKLQRKLGDAQAARAKREYDGLWPVVDPPTPATAGGEADDYYALAVATVAGTPIEAASEAKRFQERHEDSPFITSARFAQGVAQSRNGDRVQARDTLAEVADDDDTAIGRQVAALLETPEYNRLDAIRVAERKHSTDVAKFILVGDGVDGRSALYTATQFGAASVQAAESFGIFNAIGILTRAWRAWRSDPTSNQEIIDRGEEFLAREPDSPDVPDVHDRLADAYERSGNFSRALMHVNAMPNRDQKRLDKLEEKLAGQLLADAQKNHNDPVVLRGLVRHFAKTDAAETARDQLKEIPDPDSTTLDRSVLKAHPELLGPSALDLDPRLLDGNEKNGELADEGITLRDGQMRLTLRNHGDSPRVDTKPMAPDAYGRALAAAEEVLYQRLLTADRRSDEEGKYERYIPFFIQGSIDDTGGVAVAPGVKLRRYKSSEPSLYE